MARAIATLSVLWHAQRALGAGGILDDGVLQHVAVINTEKWWRWTTQRDLVVIAGVTAQGKAPGLGFVV